jgi:hypothetical protein
MQAAAADSFSDVTSSDIFVQPFVLVLVIIPFGSGPNNFSFSCSNHFLFRYYLLFFRQIIIIFVIVN